MNKIPGQTFRTNRLGFPILDIDTPVTIVTHSLAELTLLLTGDLILTHDHRRCVVVGVMISVRAIRTMMVVVVAHKRSVMHHHHVIEITGRRWRRQGRLGRRQ